MNLIIRRLLTLLYKMGVFKKYSKLVYIGKATSTNTFYSAGHWILRHKKKKEHGKEFATILANSKTPKFDQMSVVLFYNGRYDVDNLSIMSKMLVDTMKGKYIVDDTKNYYISTHTVYDKTLKKGTLEFHLIGN